MNKVFIFVSYFIPGYKAGGPIRSIESLCERLSDNFDFWIATSDRDLGDEIAYSNLKLESWLHGRAFNVYYQNRARYSVSRIFRLVRDCRPDYIYLNSFFDACFSIKPLLLWRLGLLGKETKIVIAPRGEFAKGALDIKPIRKRVYIFVSRALGLYRGVLWQASGEHEASDIRKGLGPSANIRIAPNLSTNVLPSIDLIKDKNKQSLKIVCLARIARNKNILGALMIVRDLKCPVEFHIYGPMEDQAYWLECQNVINTMPSNVKIVAHGEIAHDEISKKLRQFDVFFLPTCGENFGHAIFEALKACIPVVISDLTPWRNLEKKGVGWDIDIKRHDLFLEILEYCAKISNDDYRAMQANIIKFVEETVSNDEALLSNKQLFSQ